MNSETPQSTTETAEVKHVLLPTAVEQCVRHELHHVRSHWWWFLLLGILLLVCGTLALAYPLRGSLYTMAVLSIVLLVAGVAMLVGAFWAGRWSGFLVNILVGLLYVAAGFVISEKPLGSILVITIFVAVSFMVMGMFRILAAMVLRFPQWGWMVLNGCMTFLVGLIIYRHLPLDALWVIGLLVGVEMILSGWTWIMLAMEIKRIPAEPAA
ncbi:MAG: HdeD family acid-resistance protein [Thermoguttaceae bacterium]